MNSWRRGSSPAPLWWRGETLGSCGAGTQKPSRRREIDPDKSPLHGCKSPHCCYFIYCDLREDCFLFAKFLSFVGFSPPPQRSLRPQCRRETAGTFSFLREREENTPTCLVRTRGTGGNRWPSRDKEMEVLCILNMDFHRFCLCGFVPCLSGFNYHHYYFYRWHLHTCFGTWIYLDVGRKEKATQVRTESIRDIEIHEHSPSVK